MLYTALTNKRPVDIRPQVLANNGALRFTLNPNAQIAADGLTNTARFPQVALACGTGSAKAGPDLLGKAVQVSK